MSEYTLVEITPNTEDYINIRIKAGLSGRTPEAAKIGLSNSIFAVQIIYKEQTVGIGRIIGDGGCFFQIVDVAVLPDHQKKGLGKMIMSSLMKYLDANAPKSSYVSLIADQPDFYPQFGFKDATPDAGMYRFY
jgi:ribosomal protein S18 acetylase RimI-like enzyme